jgi:hypothetical protein
MTENTRHTKSFVGWRDKIITPFVWMITLSVSICFSYFVIRQYDWGLFAGFLLFFASLVVLTLLTIAIILKLRPLKAGTFNIEKDPWTFYAWNLIG